MHPENGLSAPALERKLYLVAISPGTSWILAWTHQPFGHVGIHVTHTAQSIDHMRPLCTKLSRPSQRCPWTAAAHLSVGTDGCHAIGRGFQNLRRDRPREAARLARYTRFHNVSRHSTRDKDGLSRLVMGNGIRPVRHTLDAQAHRRGTRRFLKPGTHASYLSRGRGVRPSIDLRGLRPLASDP